MALHGIGCLFSLLRPEILLLSVFCISFRRSVRTMTAPVAEEVVIRTEGNDFMDTADSDSSEGKRTGKSQRSLVSMTDLEVAFPATMKKFPECFLCKKKANMKSPLKSGGYHPWYNYTKVINKQTKEASAKIPKGRICMICRNVYNTIGYDLKYGIKKKFAKYKEEMAKPTGTQLHKIFLEAMATWIKLYNQNDSASSTTKLSLKNKKQVRDMHRRLETAQIKRLKVEKREKEFVERKFWDEKVDGDYDTSKETQLVVDGETKTGVYRWTSREGVFKITDAEETTMENVTVWQEGEGELNEQAMGTKLAYLTQQRQQATKEKDDKTDKTMQGYQRDHLRDLFALVHGANSSSVAKPETADEVDNKSNAEATDNELASDEEELVSSEDDECSDGNEDRVASLFGQRVSAGRASGSSKQTAASTPSKKTSPTSSGKRKADRPDSDCKIGKRYSVAGGSQEHPPPAKTAQTNVQEVTLTRLDGRGERLAQAADDFVEDGSREIEGESFNEEQTGPVMMGDALKVFNTAVAKKGAVFQSISKKSTDMLRRIEASANKECLGQRREKLTELKEKAEAAVGFVNIVLKPCRDIEEALEAAKAGFLISE